jgi:uncharacterized membrane protein
MNWLQQLPGFQRTPYGLELRVLRLMPRVGIVGTALAGTMALAARGLLSADNAAQLARRLQQFDYMMIGLVILVWTLVLTVAIGCVIVWLMKGPAYVADGLAVSHSDTPRP